MVYAVQKVKTGWAKGYKMRLANKGKEIRDAYTYILNMCK